MDTVIRCSECGGEWRFNFAYHDADPEMGSVSDYDSWVEEKITEMEEEHDCEEDRAAGTKYDR
jgi:hypothetical protein